jgi:hypothetical protein
MSRGPRFVIGLELQDASEHALSHLSSDQEARQILTVRNVGSRPYHVQAWATPGDPRVTYPHSSIASVMTPGYLDPGSQVQGIDAIMYVAAGHPTPVKIELRKKVDWRADNHGSWSTRDLDSQHIDCHP